MAVAVDTLKTCPLFAGFSATGIEIFAQIARPRAVPKGMSVFLAGSVADSLYVLASGCLEVLVERDGRAKLLDVLEPGAAFGELALVRPGRRAMTVKARSAAQLVEIRRNDFYEILPHKPQACLKLLLAIIASLDERLAPLHAQLIELAGR